MIILNSLIVRIDGILNTNLKLSMLIKTTLVTGAYLYQMSREVG